MPQYHNNTAAFPGFFFAVNYLLLLVIGLYIARDGWLSPESWVSALFVFAALVGYAALYLSPTLLLVALAYRFALPGSGRLLGVVLTSLTVILLLVDSRVHSLYGFHINGFVWNLLVTPGGIASMGGGGDTVLTVSLLCAAVVLGETLLMWAGARRSRLPRRLIAVLILCMVGERLAYGWSDLHGYRPILHSARGIPFYQPATFEGLARDLGYRVERRRMAMGADTEGVLAYPLRPLQRREGAPSPNILFLVAESLRADMLTEEIMPNLWRFAEQRGRRYTRHFSGGNGTRMGVFSLFYGLPGNYWFSFLNAQRPPVLMTELQRRNYRLGLYTSARFSYPEFDQTVFASVPADAMISDDQGPGWQRDRRNVSRLLDFIGKGGERPWFGFLFFESPHARYYFPQESVIRKNYLKELNYATMNLRRDMPLIFNRYINSVHHLDQQLGRIFSKLERDGLLDKTLVVVTGDHGEEFMEHGRWGHNSEFHNEQIRVPLVMAGAGLSPAVIRRPTSHLDVPPTLLRHLGVTNPPADYAVGVPLSQAEPGRYRLAASWDALAYLGPEYKVAMPMNAGGLGEMTISKASDEPVENEAVVMTVVRDRLVKLLDDMSRFYRR